MDIGNIGIEEKLNYYCLKDVVDFYKFLDFSDSEIKYNGSLKHKMHVVSCFLFYRSMPYNRVVEAVNSGKIQFDISRNDAFDVMIEFISHKFTLLMSGKEFYFYELPSSYRKEIANCFEIIQSWNCGNNYFTEIVLI